MPPPPHRIQVFTPEGQFIRAIGGAGREPKRFRHPTGIALDKFGNLYVSDMGNDRIQVFDKELKFKFSWGSPGQRPGEFGNLHGIIVDDDGFVYVGDTANNRIQVFQMLDFG